MLVGSLLLVAVAVDDGAGGCCCFSFGARLLTLISRSFAQAYKLWSYFPSLVDRVSAVLALQDPGSPAAAVLRTGLREFEPAGSVVNWAVSIAVPSSIRHPIPATCSSHGISSSCPPVGCSGHLPVCQAR